MKRTRNPYTNPGAQGAAWSLGAIISKMRPQVSYNSSRTTKTGAKAADGIEIRFGQSRPTESTRELMKQHGFRFSERQLIWYAKDTPQTRRFAEEFATMEVEVDSAQYEKRIFLKPVLNQNAFENLSNYTEFYVKPASGGEGAFYKSKAKLLGRYYSVHELIRSGRLFFKKYFNKEIDPVNSGTVTQTAEPVSSQSSDPSGAMSKRYDEIAAALRSKADAMQQKIDSKINPAISRQRPTQRRMRIAQGMANEGYKLQDIQKTLYALANAWEDRSIDRLHYVRDIRTASQINDINDYELYSKPGWNLENGFESKKDRFNNLGLRVPEEWGFAYDQLKNLLNNSGGNSQPKYSETERLIREKTAALVGRKIPGFFPTPKTLIEQMIDLSGYDGTGKVLEPSAGKGDILDALKEQFGEGQNLNACEVNYDLREILKLKGYSVVHHDFTQYDPPEEEHYDFILMNPPFENGQDIDHFMRAINFVKPGGTIVCVMSEGAFTRSFTKEKNFQAYVNTEPDITVSDTIEEAFKNGFNTTSVRVRLVTFYNSSEPAYNAPVKKITPDKDILEAEALAELELAKAKLELERRKKQKAVNGLSKSELGRLQKLERQALELDEVSVLDFH